jgi:hypothetical protein
MKLIASTAIIATFVGITPLSAMEAGEPSSAIMGAGNISCETYASARQEGTAANNAAMSSWIHGYLTGMNDMTENITGQPANIIGYTAASAATIDADLWIFFDNYCAENPSDILHDAASALTNALWDREGITASPEE